MSGHTGEQEGESAARGEAAVLKRHVEHVLRPLGYLGKSLFHGEETRRFIRFVDTACRGAPEDAADEFGDEEAVSQAQGLEVGLDGGVSFFPLVEFTLAERSQCI
ncbi:MAG: hypothetical protein EOP88_02840 [Verrucomicrobiaceae bacterium]|nr:MAG: hypothetical protein EOP88_02840 [Verrucomicrobiaceae bacterium]